MRRIAFLGLVLSGMVGLCCARAWAEDAPPSKCTDIDGPKSAIEAEHGQWKLLTTDQWEFLRGVYVLNPNTPPGLPYGDRAVLAQIDGSDGGMVFFIDHDRACTPMTLPGELIKMLGRVGGGADVEHEHAGSGL